MKKLILLFLGITSIALISKAQPVEDELGFKYVKAKYLMETERYEDAIKAFTAIVKEDSKYEEALLYRAEAKYKIAAYKGTKKDILEFISYKGISDKALVLLGKSFYKLGDNTAALNTLLTASSASLDTQVFEFLGNIYQENGKLLKACKIWEEGAELGSSKCESKSRKICGSTRPTSSKKPTEKASKKQNTDGGLGNRKDDILSSGTRHSDKDIKGNKTEEENEDGVLSSGTRRSDTDIDMTGTSSNNSEETNDKEDEEAKKEIENSSGYPIDDDTPNKIEIDEELDIIIYGNELGRRKVLDQPNILILSEDIGQVAIDICINKRGKVESAEYNGELSSIKKQSLITLAIRKAKDFWFEKSDYKEQCGVMIFDKKM